MSDPDGKHVFVSHVHEDNDQVDVLCKVLEAAGIPYWRDRKSLAPGDAWKAKIRQAIRDGSLVFLACFSDNSRARSKSYMNEELTLAVEEFRQMPPGRIWLIPIRFDAGDLPEWDLGAGRALADLNQVDLFGDDYAAQAAALVTTVHRVMGDRRLSSASAMAAIELATNADRINLLRRLTKDMLLEPSRRIELDELIGEEVRRLMAVLNDPETVAGPLPGSSDDQAVEAARRANALWELTQPFCASLQVAARWGTPDLLSPWAGGLRSFLTTAQRMEAGNSLLLAQRHLPGMIGIVTATIASVSAGRWDNLRTLVVDPTVRDRYDNTALPLIEATAPYRPFGDTDRVSLTLARAVATGKDYAEALRDYTQRRQPKLYTPASDWLHDVLRPLFTEQIADDDTYDFEFDRMEAIIGALVQDLTNTRRAAQGKEHLSPHAYWIGRATWRTIRNRRPGPVQELADELARQGDRWAPLQAGLFGGDQTRAQAALDAHGQQFNHVASRQF